MIHNIDELKKNISHLDQDVQDEFIKWVTPFYDFHEYMKIEYNKTFEDIENESAKFSEEVLTDYLTQINTIDSDKNSSIEFIIGISGKIYKRYSESYDYSKSDELELALTKYMELLFKYKMTNGK